ncbi:MAG: ATP-binding protein, partial [Planctomycetota bacterium]
VLRGALELQPESGLFAERVAKGRSTYTELGPIVAARFADIAGPLTVELESAGVELEARRAALWRTITLSTLAYAGLVLLLWRFTVARLIRPLQALTREARGVHGGERGFHLKPDGPHEVRLLTESVATLVTNLIGARSNLEEKVLERTAELERANRAKNEFLANMSHEIRTPMTAILGYAELCLAHDIPDTDRRRYAEIIYTNGEHLLSVINDILDISKIEAGRMTVEPTVCAPFEIVSEIRALMEVRAREKGLTLTVENVGSIPEIVRTDSTRLRQILLNLVNNALKFTDKGSVVLRFSCEQVEGGRERLLFEVVDTGVGLTSAQIDKVFRPFVQADTSTTRKYGGTGLGLTISKTLAELLGGDLTCTSEPGQGSTFRVWIDPGPLEGVRRIEEFPKRLLSGRPQRPLAGPGPAMRGRVLLAEDVAVNRRLISTILLRAGIRVDEAENGQVALEKTLAAREGGRPYDIVFMDMQMPIMDGYEATRQLRTAGYLRPIVALTSHSMAGERQRCLDAGCDEYMTKPLDRLVLIQVLGRFLPNDEAEEHRAA